jgi:homoserine kinase
MALKAGALGVALSGAGPSIAAFCTTSTQEIAERMRHAFAQNQISCEARILSIDSTGATVQVEE